MIYCLLSLFSRQKWQIPLAQQIPQKLTATMAIQTLAEETSSRCLIALFFHLLHSVTSLHFYVSFSKKDSFWFFQSTNV